MLRIAGLVAVAALVFAGWYAYSRGAPACEGNFAMSQVYPILRDRYHLDSILVNDVRSTSGGLFSRQRECSAEVTEVRGNINASDMHWRSIEYSIAAGTDNHVTVTLGGDVPLAEPRPPLWKRLLALL